MILTENNQTVREDKAICQIFNTYFTNVTKGLKLQQVDESQSFENEESCRLIRENYGGESFSFKSISKDDITEAVKKLPLDKASISNDMLLWKACKYFWWLPKRKQVSEFNENCWN